MKLILNLPAEISKLYELISMSKNIGGVEVNLITSSCGGWRAYASCAYASLPCVFYVFYHLAYGISFCSS